jgi:hypothetical protein
VAAYQTRKNVNKIENRTLAQCTHYIYTYVYACTHTHTYACVHCTLIHFVLSLSLSPTHSFFLYLEIWLTYSLLTLLTVKFPFLAQLSQPRKHYRLFPFYKKVDKLSALFDQFLVKIINCQLIYLQFYFYFINTSINSTLKSYKKVTI